MRTNFTTHNAGVHYACYRLSCLNWRIAPIREGRQEFHRIWREDEQFVIKIHSLSKVAPVPFRQGLDMLDCIDYLVICNNLQGEPNIIAIKPQTVRDVIHKDTKNEGVYWLQHPDYNKYGLDFKIEFGEK